MNAELPSSELRLILRANALDGVNLDEIAEAIVRAGEEAGVDHAFVELLYQARSVDHALELAGRILARRHRLMGRAPRLRGARVGWI